MLSLVAPWAFPLSSLVREKEDNATDDARSVRRRVKGSGRARATTRDWSLRIPSFSRPGVPRPAHVPSVASAARARLSGTARVPQRHWCGAPATRPTAAPQSAMPRHGGRHRRCGCELPVVKSLACVSVRRAIHACRSATSQSLRTRRSSLHRGVQAAQQLRARSELIVWRFSGERRHVAHRLVGVWVWAQGRSWAERRGAWGRRRGLA